MKLSLITFLFVSCFLIHTKRWFGRKLQKCVLRFICFMLSGYLKIRRTLPWFILKSLNSIYLQNSIRSLLTKHVNHKEKEVKGIDNGYQRRWKIKNHPISCPKSKQNWAKKRLSESTKFWKNEKKTIRVFHFHIFISNRLLRRKSWFPFPQKSHLHHILATLCAYW